MSDLTSPADQGLAAQQLAELVRQHLASAEDSARAAEAAQRLADALRGQS